MSIEFSSLIIPAFIAGLLTFLAPCTFPLVPGYLGFISGISLGDTKLQSSKEMKKKILYNGLMYVLGFSVVFILLGSIFGAIGSFLTIYRIWLSRIGGIFIMFFGLYLMGIFHLPMFQFLQKEKHIPIISHIQPGKPLSSFIFGMTFAFGWTPCVGPVLGSILILASTSATLISGAVLLSIFSFGLALPFLLMALFIGQASGYIQKLGKYLRLISIIGGAFLVFLGIILFTDRFAWWISWFYHWFDFLHLEKLLRFY